MCLGWDLIRIIWYPEHCVSVSSLMPRYSADGRPIALAKALNKSLETSSVSVHTASLVFDLVLKCVSKILFQIS